MGRKRTRNKKDTNSLESINSRAGEFLPKRRHEIGGDKCTVVDGMHLAYRAYYAHKNFRHKGKPTSIIFGVINMLKSFIFQNGSAKVIVCWDGGNHPERLKLLPEYRSSRKKKRDPEERKAFIKQLQRVQRMLYYLGIPQAYNPKVEGDDMVYLVTQEMVKLYKIRILSGDKDFKQLINKDIHIHNPNEKYGEDWTTFFLHAKVEVYQYVDWLSLVGDDSDDIPGYRGIGPVRAQKFLNKFGSIRNFIKNRMFEFSGISDRKALKRIWKRNRRLIDLKWFNEKYHTSDDITYIRGRRNPDFNPEKFKEQCLRFGLKTFLFEKFLEPFKKLANE